MNKVLTLALVGVLLLGLAGLVGCSNDVQPAPSAPPVNNSSSSAPAATTAPAGPTSAISITNFTFAPADEVVKVGTTVTWTNNDSVMHTVTGATFDSGQLAPGATYSHTFSKAGSFDYKCTIHPQMTARITVQ